MKKHGFTLIELLVVVAIISLLVSILLPSLTKARELARKVRCAANLKGIGVGVYLYSSDHDEALPRAEDIDANGAASSDKWAWWDPGVVYPYLGFSTEVSDYELPIGGILACPEETARRNYAASGRVFTWSWMTATPPPRRFAMFVPEMPMFSEAWAINMPSVNLEMLSFRTIHWDYWSLPQSPYGDQSRRLALRHDGGANYLFVGGHVTYNVGIPNRTFWISGGSFDMQYEE